MSSISVLYPGDALGTLSLAVDDPGHAAQLIAAGSLFHDGQFRDAATHLMTLGHHPKIRHPRVVAGIFDQAAVAFRRSAASENDRRLSYLRISDLQLALEAYELAENPLGAIRTHYALGRAHLDARNFLAASLSLETALQRGADRRILDPHEYHDYAYYAAQAFAAALDAVVSGNRTALLGVRKRDDRDLLGIKAAAYHHLSGSMSDAADYLMRLTSIYMDAAEKYYRGGKQFTPQITLVQGAYLGIAAGVEGMIDRVAEKLAFYGASQNDGISVRIYEDAIRLAQLGMQEVAQERLVEHAERILTRYSGPLHLSHLLEIISAGYDYLFIETCERLVKAPMASSGFATLQEDLRAYVIRPLTMWMNTVIRFNEAISAPQKSGSVQTLMTEGLTQLDRWIVNYDRMVDLSRMFRKSSGNAGEVGTDGLFAAKVDRMVDDIVERGGIMPLCLVLSGRFDTSPEAVYGVLAMSLEDADLESEMRATLGDIAVERLTGAVFRYQADTIERRWSLVKARRGR